MTKIEDVKQAYPLFKFFKDYYSVLNKASYVVMSGCDNHIKLHFAQNNKFYLLYGTIEEKNIFTEWLNGKSVRLHYKDLISLKSVLKKNVHYIEYTYDVFVFSFSTKDGEEQSVKFYSGCHDGSISKINGVLNQLVTSHDFDGRYLNNEIFIPYEENGSIYFDRSENRTKIIEYPSKKILSQQKDAKYNISFSPLGDSIRFVSINSESDKVTLSQIFATI